MGFTQYFFSGLYILIISSAMRAIPGRTDVKLTLLCAPLLFLSLILLLGLRAYTNKRKAQLVAKREALKAKLAEMKQQKDPHGMASQQFEISDHDPDALSFQGSILNSDQLHRRAGISFLRVLSVRHTPHPDLLVRNLVHSSDSLMLARHGTDSLSSNPAQTNPNLTLPVLPSVDTDSEKGFKGELQLTTSVIPSQQETAMIVSSQNTTTSTPTTTTTTTSFTYPTPRAHQPLPSADGSLFDVMMGTSNS
jgi:hypothetical protein